MKNESKIIGTLERQKESGLTIRDFCSNEGIAPSSFYYWKKKLNNDNSKGFIPLVVRTSPVIAKGQDINQKEQHGNHFTNSDYNLEIGYPNGIILRIKNNLDLAQLRALISLLD